MNATKQKKIRLKKLEIVDFKSIDKLTLEFPVPDYNDDLDVFIFGSINGVGKTSILEAICLLRLAPFLKPRQIPAIDSKGKNQTSKNIDLNLTQGKNQILNSNLNVALIVKDLEMDSFVRAGRNSFKLTGIFELEGNEEKFELCYDKSKNETKITQPTKSEFSENFEITKRIINAFKGQTGEPFFIDPITYFHSYRKISNDKPSLEAISADNKTIDLLISALISNDKLSINSSSYSSLKIDLINALLTKSDVFETSKDLNRELNKRKLEFFNKIIKVFIGKDFKMEKLRNMPDGTIDLLITNSENETFSFDNLSSGQKEVLDIFYIIWKNSQSSDSTQIILLDEPELHLNSEWQPLFIESLKEFCPNNQYIISTHSLKMAESVDSNRRTYLEK